MSSQLLTLDAWAEKVYGDAAPNQTTLRRWARNGNIYPAPSKHGRAYFVRPDARYTSLGDISPSLVDRIRHGATTKKRA